MNFLKILSILLIFIATTFGWFVLGGAMTVRSTERSGELGGSVHEGWGPRLTQKHPGSWYTVPGAARPEVPMAPESSRVRVGLQYDPKKKGLLRHRTYEVDFLGEYVFRNPSPVRQTIYIRFILPDPTATYWDFSFRLGDGEISARTPEKGVLVEAVELQAGEEVDLQVRYQARGTDFWGYTFGENARIRDFALEMTTDFAAIDFPNGTGSPTTRDRTPNGWQLQWDYPDVLSARAIGMEMPAVLNAGPVAARISFFAPVSLLFFFAVLLILGMVRGENLHPMNYFFLAAGFFAFQLLFAYLVDVMPVHLSFSLAALSSMVLVGGYVHAVSRGKLTRLALVAQFTYMVLFSYSFFVEGMTGLTITLGAVATLAVLMLATARIDWTEKFGRRATI